MTVKTVVVGPIETNCYIVSGNDGKSDYLMVVDPGSGPNGICNELPADPTHIVLTHGHFDHVGGLDYLKQRYPSAVVVASENFSRKEIGFLFPKTVDADIQVHEGDVVCGFRILFTPGHTLDSMCLLNESEKVLFSGDTLFCGGEGRTDLGGDPDAMKKSIARLLQLDAGTVVYPGHGCTTTIGEEKHSRGIY